MTLSDTEADESREPLVALPSSPDERCPSEAVTILPSKPVVRLSRETGSWRTMLILCGGLVSLDLSRQMCTYAMKYHNHGVFPVTPSALVFFVELIKLQIFGIKLLFETGSCFPASAISFAYVVPSALYAANNNIYFVALYFTTPPVWNILMQSRIIATALVYKFYFKKAFTKVKWLALAVLTLSIIVLQFTGADMTEGGNLNWNIVITLSLAILAAVISSVGPIYAEYLLKHDERSFDDKQMQMYFFGSLVTGTFHLVGTQLKGDDGSASKVTLRADNSATMDIMVVYWLGSTVAVGILIAVVIKKLDNIVKLYTQAVSSSLTALGCAIIFPLAFRFDAWFLVSFGLNLLAIYMYEVNNPFCQNTGITV